jgi:hypothetical protein
MARRESPEPMELVERAALEAWVESAAMERTDVPGLREPILRRRARLDSLEDTAETVGMGEQAEPEELEAGSQPKESMATAELEASEAMVVMGAMAAQATLESILVKTAALEAIAATQGMAELEGLAERLEERQALPVLTPMEAMAAREDPGESEEAARMETMGLMARLPVLMVGTDLTAATEPTAEPVAMAASEDREPLRESMETEAMPAMEAMEETEEAEELATMEFCLAKAAAPEEMEGMLEMEEMEVSEDWPEDPAALMVLMESVGTAELEDLEEMEGMERPERMEKQEPIR